MSILPSLSEGKPGRVVVSGGPLKPTLLESSEVTTIGFYDRFGDLHTVLYRVFSDDMWGMCTTQDDDWAATLIRLGIPNTKGNKDVVVVK